MTALSVLDLSPVTEGGSPAQSMRNSLDLARRTEALGYRRYWLAEHHNMPGIASAATAVVIAHVAGGTSALPGHLDSRFRENDARPRGPCGTA